MSTGGQEGAGRAGVGGGQTVRTLRSRLLRMHSAAKTCSPTLLNSSMLPRAHPPARSRRPPLPAQPPHTKHRPRPRKVRPAHARRCSALSPRRAAPRLAGGSGAGQ